jgi:hypothetical protein
MTKKKTWDTHSNEWQEQYKEFQETHHCPNCGYGKMRWRLNQGNYYVPFKNWNGICNKCNNTIVVPVKQVNITAECEGSL